MATAVDDYGGGDRVGGGGAGTLAGLEEIDEQIWIQEQERTYTERLAENDGIWARGSYARFLAELTGRKDEAAYPRRQSWMHHSRASRGSPGMCSAY